MPTGQRTHASDEFCPRLLLYVPATHGVKASASELAPALGQKPPAGQVSQAVALYPSEKVPVGHGTQAALPALGWYCPG